MKTLSILILVIFLPSLLWANGGAYDISHFRKTGDIRLLQQADIQLIREDLNIQIVGNLTFVTVQYVLQNKGKKQKVHYGFPVDAYVNVDSPMSPFHEYYPIVTNANQGFKTKNKSR